MERYGVSRNSLREALGAGLMHRLVGRVPEEDLAELDALVERMHTELREGTRSRPAPTAPSTGWAPRRGGRARHFDDIRGRLSQH